MITAKQAREMIVKPDSNSVQVLTTYITKRIEELISLSCQRGSNRVTYDAFFTLEEEKNELTKREACVTVVSMLKKAGYTVDLTNFEFTIQW